MQRRNTSDYAFDEHVHTAVQDDAVVTLCEADLSKVE